LPGRGGVKAGTKIHFFAYLLGKWTSEVALDRTSNVDTTLIAPIECLPRTRRACLRPEESAVSTIKIIITLLVFIIGILFLGRFLF
jgi:hypothetical protein